MHRRTFMGIMSAAVTSLMSRIKRAYSSDRDGPLTLVEMGIDGERVGRASLLFIRHEVIHRRGVFVGDKVSVTAVLDSEAIQYLSNYNYESPGTMRIEFYGLALFWATSPIYQVGHQVTFRALADESRPDGETIGYVYDSAAPLVETFATER